MAELCFAAFNIDRRLAAAEPEAGGHDAVEPEGGNRVANGLYLRLRRGKLRQGKLAKRQLCPAGGGEVLQDVGEDLARDEEIAPALGDENIADGLALDARAHERTEKITVGQAIVREKLRADGGAGAVTGGKPAFVQIVRQPEAHFSRKELP